MILLLLLQIVQKYVCFLKALYLNRCHRKLLLPKNCTPQYLFTGKLVLPSTFFPVNKYSWEHFFTGK